MTPLSGYRELNLTVTDSQGLESRLGGGWPAPSPAPRALRGRAAAGSPEQRFSPSFTKSSCRPSPKVQAGAAVTSPGREF